MICFILFCSAVVCQNDTNNKRSFIEVDFISEDDVKEILRTDSLPRKYQGKSIGTCYFYSLLNVDCGEQCNDGIYAFGQLGSHKPTYIMLVDNDKMKVIIDYSIENVFTMVIEFFKKNDISRDKKITSINSVNNILSQW